MSTPRSQLSQSSPGGKRRRDCIDNNCLTNRTPSPLSTSTTPNKPYRSAAEAVTAYWDAFSHIPLTPGALYELDRRAPRPRRIAIGGNPGLESGEIIKHSAKLQRACRHGGLDLRHLRGYSQFKKASEPSTEMVQLIGTGDAMFGKHLAIHRIYPNDGYVTQPQNFDEILAMLEQPRREPAESYDAQYREFRQVAMEIADKSDVMKKILPLIVGTSNNNNNSRTSGGHAFNNMKNLTDGSIVKLKPDIYDGADPNQIDAEILKKLCSFLQPLEKKESPVVPTFFAQFKGPKTEDFVPEHQVRYAGALGARAIHQLRSFAVADPETVYDNNTYTITATYQNRVLTIYVHRPVKPLAPGGGPDPAEYRMTFANEFAMYRSLDSFQKGVVAFRNALEWAATKRAEFIAAANARKQTIAIPPAPGLPAPPSSTVS